MDIEQIARVIEQEGVPSEVARRYAERSKVYKGIYTIKAFGEEYLDKEIALWKEQGVDIEFFRKTDKRKYGAKVLDRARMYFFSAEGLVVVK